MSVSKLHAFKEIVAGVLLMLVTGGLVRAVLAASIPGLIFCFALYIIICFVAGAFFGVIDVRHESENQHVDNPPTVPTRRD